LSKAAMIGKIVEDNVHAYIPDLRRNGGAKTDSCANPLLFGGKQVTN